MNSIKIKKAMKLTLIEFLKAAPAGLLLMIMLAAPMFFVRGLEWCSEPYYTAEDIAWTICDKYYHNSYRVSNSYWIVLEYSTGDETTKKTVLVEEEVWSGCAIGDIVTYPAEIINNWEHYVKGINSET